MASKPKRDITMPIVSAPNPIPDVSPDAGYDSPELATSLSKLMKAVEQKDKSATVLAASNIAPEVLKAIGQDNLSKILSGEQVDTNVLQIAPSFFGRLTPTENGLVVMMAVDALMTKANDYMK